MTGKICLVTGASSGIGLATALDLLGAGHTVYGGARHMQRMDVIRDPGGHALAGTLVRMHRFLPDRVFDKLVTRQR
jgi:NADP-dependent 3-hydroxy acid dehydrogenase YdfG